MKRFLLVGFACLIGCTEDRSAGTASQTGNSVVAGRLLRADSTPARGVQITLQPAVWPTDPSAAVERAVKTDSAGGFRFADVDPGLWRLESQGESTSLVRTLRLRAGRDSTLPPLVTSSRGKVVVEVHLDDTLRAGKLVVMGLSRQWSLSSADREIFVPVEGLAPGIHWFSIRAANGRELREAAFLARSGRVDTLRDADWKREGAGPSEDDELEPEGEEHE